MTTPIKHASLCNVIWASHRFQEYGNNTRYDWIVACTGLRGTNTNWSPGNINDLSNSNIATNNGATLGAKAAAAVTCAHCRVILDAALDGRVKVIATSSAEKPWRVELTP